MFKNRMTISICTIAAIIPLLLYMYLYRQMPDFVPIHYNGEVADRFVDKRSYEVLIVSLFSWFGFALIRLLQLLLRKLFLRSYIENLALNHRIWNAATVLVTVGFSVVSIFALLAMV